MYWFIQAVRVVCMSKSGLDLQTVTEIMQVTEFVDASRAGVLSLIISVSFPVMDQKCSF
jgi:hypothetical protein